MKEGQEAADRAADSAGADSGGESAGAADLGHPRGTLAVLVIYMALFVAGWIGLYFFLFLSRGATSF